MDILKDKTKKKSKDTYSPKIIESGKNESWQNLINKKIEEKEFKDVFVMILPPPNITGSLHLGHALTISIQDILVRYNRMLGKEVLYIPGLDHAGIATQTIVEKNLLKLEGKTRHDLGREEFVNRIWNWKNEYGNKILNQISRLGASLDNNRLRFTMDEISCKTVNHAFIKLYESGKIYRDKKMVSWSMSLASTVSNDETRKVELKKSTLINVPGYSLPVEFGVLHTFSYVIDSNHYIQVSTTRLETMFGDIAIAVHPKDTRYTHLHQKHALHPFLKSKIDNMPLKLIIIVDDSVDPTFGTGAVKITPCHDLNDYNMAKRHLLLDNSKEVFDNNGNINISSNYTDDYKFHGMPRYLAREAIVKELTTLGLYHGKIDNPMTISICERSGDVIEPVLREQWFIDCKEMSRKALLAVESGNIEILPIQHRTTWRKWMEKCDDWTISRQLYWGHRIPAYKNKIDQKWYIAASREEALKLSGNTNIEDLEQDPDVLDTWFSSALFPLSTVNYFEKENLDYKKYYPSSILETGHDILFFWVARMVMLCQELTGIIPFKKVYLHPMVRDKYGEKMSKSKGNVIDPIDIIDGISLKDWIIKLQCGNLNQDDLDIAIINLQNEYPNGLEECGTDALRFCLAGQLAHGSGKDVNFDPMRVMNCRKFCNKLYNIGKFIEICIKENTDIHSSTKLEKWILSKLGKVTTQVHSDLNSFQLANASQVITSFVLDDFCSIFIEMYKLHHDRECFKTLIDCYKNILLLLHPFIPFLTEELYSKINPTGSSIMLEKYPALSSVEINETVELEMNVVMKISQSIKNACAMLQIKEKPIVLYSSSKYDFLKDYTIELSNCINSLDEKDEKDEKVKKHCKLKLQIDKDLYLLLLFENEYSMDKLILASKKLNMEIDTLKRTIENTSFKKSPIAIQEKTTLKLDALLQKLASLPFLLI